jgi:uncharacterized protein YdeI (BOF family)
MDGTRGTRIRLLRLLIVAVVGALLVAALPLAAGGVDAKNGKHTTGKGQPAQKSVKGNKGAKQTETGDTETSVSASGKLVVTTSGDEKLYALQDSTGKTIYYLDAGPPWYWKAKNGSYPLDQFSGQQVSVTGEVDTAEGNGKGNGNSGSEPALNAPELSVFTINGQTLRGPGKPPWAGGPKVVPGHPGAKNKP